MLGLLALTVVASSEPPASQVLAENRRAIALWQDEGMRTTYAPYFDCYWAQVKDQPDSNLRDAQRAQAMFTGALSACASAMGTADRQADAYLSSLPAYEKPEVRRDTILRYRRQIGTLTLLQHYQDAGKGALINQYMAELGEKSRKP